MVSFTDGLPAFDLPAYLVRVGLAAAPPPDEAGLSALLLAHLCAIPFENLDYFVDAPYRPLVPEASFDRLVRRSRGGGCDEHVLVFAGAAHAVGFETEVRQCRVVVVHAESVTPRSHAVVVVRRGDDAWIADPGFGGPGCRLALPFVDGAQVTSAANETHRLDRRADGAWVVSGGFGGGEVRPLYVFRDEPATMPDLELVHHWAMRHPGSPLLRGPNVMRYTPEGRAYVRGAELVRVRGSEVEREPIGSLDAFAAIVREVFGLDVPARELESAYAALARASLPPRQGA